MPNDSPEPGTGHATATPREMVRVGTWNVQGRALTDPATIAHRIDDLALDVVCFQEVQRSQFASIQSTCQLTHGAWWFKHWSIRYAPEGLATLSRWPVIGDPVLRALTHGRRVIHYSRRIAGAVRLEHPSGPLEVWNTHLSPGGAADTTVRLGEIDQLVQTIAPTRAILAGDLNFTPSGPEVERLAAGGLTDGFDLAHPGTAVMTNLTANRDRLVQRLDYVLVTPDLADQVVDAQVPGALEPFDKSWWALSDHLPLVVEISLGG